MEAEKTILLLVYEVTYVLFRTSGELFSSDCFESVGLHELKN